MKLRQIVKNLIPSKILEFRKKLMQRPKKISKLEQQLMGFVGKGMGVESYHIGYLKKIAPLVKGKTVLEVGGSGFSKKVLFDTLGAKKWVCVDYLENWGKDREVVNGLNQLFDNSDKQKDFAVFPLDKAENSFNACDYIKFSGDAAHISEIFYGKFDVVVSANAFEHILPLKEAVEKIYLCLNKNGKFYTSFAPIWSCAFGHHYAGEKIKDVVVNYNYSFNTTERDGIPPFIHLLKNEQEMREYFANKTLPFGLAQLDCLCRWAYHTDEINRLFFEDYEEIMVSSKFKKYKIIPIVGQIPTNEILLELRRKYPKYKRFDIGAVEIFARK